MHAERGRAVGFGEFAAGEYDGEARDYAGHGVVHLAVTHGEQAAAVPEVPVVDRLVHGANGSARHIGSLEALQCLGAGDLLHALLNLFARLDDVRGAAVELGEALVREKLGGIERVAEPLPLVIARRGDGQFAIARAVQACGAAARCVAHSQGQTHLHVVLKRVHHHDRCERVHHRNVEVLALAGALFFPQRSRNRVAGEERRHEVADVKANAGRGTVGMPVDLHEAAHALNLRVMRGPVGIFAGLPVA